MRGVAIGLVLAICAIGVSVVPSGAAMMDMKGSIKMELKTAAFHAGELAQKGAITATKLHLQHVMNCLEGPSGPHFVAAAGFPCQNQGNGIVPDLKAAVKANVPGAQAALQDATIAWNLTMQGQGMTDVTEAQPWAAVAARYLTKASDDLDHGMM